MNKLIGICLAVVILTTGCGSSSQPTIPTPTVQYEIVGISAENYLVVVDPNVGVDRNALFSIANYLCTDKDYCSIYFWDDINIAPSKMPLTAEQDQAIIASYGRNKKTGYDELLVCGLGDC